MASFDPFTPDFLQDPYPALAALRERDPVHRSDVLQAWVLTRFDDCQRVLKRNAQFSSNPRNATSQMMKRRQQEKVARKMDAPLLLQSDPPTHTRLRSIVVKAFTKSRIEKLRDRIAVITDRLLDAAFDGGDSVDVMAALANQLPNIMIAELLGVPPDDQEMFKRWAVAITRMANPRLTPVEMAEVHQCRRELITYLEAFIADRRKNPQDDLITALVQAEEHGERLTLPELQTFCVLLLVGGIETTTSLIGNGTVALARHPEQLARLRGDSTLWPSAIEEFIRWMSPVQGAPRYAMENLEIRDRRIGKGDTVFAMVGAANRDPEKFDRPDDVDVGRHPNPHLGYGAGIHFCVGAQLARLEASIVIPKLLDRVEMLELVDPEPRFQGSFILRTLTALPIRVR